MKRRCLDGIRDGGNKGETICAGVGYPVGFCGNNKEGLGGQIELSGI